MPALRFLRVAASVTVLSQVFLITIPVQVIQAGRYDTAHLSITAQGLFDEYTRNEIAADEKYKDRQLNVGGVIQKVGRDNGIPYITFLCSETTSLGTGTMTIHSAVRCLFDPKDEHRLAQLQTGRTFSVYGTVVGKKNREVLLKDCSL